MSFGRILLLFASAMLLSLVVYLYVHLGWHRPVHIKKNLRPAMHLLTYSRIGPYHQIGEDLRKIEKWANQHQLPCTQTFAEFLDSPEKVDADRLRANIGCVLPNSVTNESLQSTIAAEKAPYKFEIRASEQSVYAEFSGSPSIGPFVVYPKIQDFAQQSRLKLKQSNFEIYTVNGENVVTEYWFTVD